MSNKPETMLAKSDEQIAWVLGHEGMSPWLKRALLDALATDPIAAGNDVEVLRHLLQARAEAWARDQLQAVYVDIPPPSGKVGSCPSTRS